MNRTHDDQPAHAPAMPSVPLLDLKRQHDPLQGQFVEALANICRTGQFCLGPDVKQLEESVAKYSGAKHAIGCASGSDALLLAMMALDLGPGDEVIVPSFTFFATASAVARLGATPVFADIEPVTFNIDPADVQHKITSKTKAIIPVHLYGQCAEMDVLLNMAEAARIVVVEDAAQAIGAEFDGRRAGSMGQLGCLSFYPTKNLGGAGDSGMVTSNDDALADKIRLLRVHGMEPRYYHGLMGVNSRMDAFQAAILNVKLPYLDGWTRMRSEIAQLYTDMFIEAGLDRFLTLPRALPHRRHVWNQYVIRVPEGRRDDVRTYLNEANIGAEVYYPLGLHEQECFGYLGYSRGDLPETDRATAEVLALPIFPRMTAVEQAAVVGRIAQYYAGPARGHKLAGPKFLKHRTGTAKDSH
ncbi:MAG: DegT/DnrJ/EryC1/StrS family aminotransferase [Thermoguttaceae bacterium]